ncbi:alternate signal-mediated exported protein [Okibacterium sp. HSC-33S16]|uniref:alternate-type signal peptide domain-containing protein n=1 Tax=Okibacterium sp. HSC-33S16 TaxID=2910965 RepID=UPI0020A1ABE7|nr:alternate-type signal peptide domain-containing protein [Okibacterium sp. HSC-33S16]MCP2031444.1 alternate signal-mediated exported protein [Okibacterium sp. HSC-33S16]
MKKSTRSLLGASSAALLGVILLLGGTGTLASWTSNTTSSTQQIQSGTLQLGSTDKISLTGATILHCTSVCPLNAPAEAYTGQVLVPGDVITATMSIPVTLTGQNMKANFSVSPRKAAGTADASGVVIATDADTALATALQMSVTQIDGQKLKSAPDTTQSIGMGVRTTPVVVTLEIKFPWGEPGQFNKAMGGTVGLTAVYSLTQVAG